MPPPLPLNGLLAVELGTSVAGPFAGRVLADLGAEVVKIENPQGGDDARNWGPPFVRGAAPIFNAVNRNKRSAAVDLKDDARARRCVVSSSRTPISSCRICDPAWSRATASTPRPCAAQPALIYCNLAAYGAEGPLRHLPGYDPLLQAFGGLMSLTGEEGREPVRTGPSIIDQGSAMGGDRDPIGALSAHRHRRGLRGRHLALRDCAQLGQHARRRLPGERRVPRRMGSENFGICPYKGYEARDGWVVIAAGNDNLFRRLADAVGRPEWPRDPRFKTNPDRVTHREELNRLLAELIATDTVGTWVGTLRAAGVPARRCSISRR